MRAVIQAVNYANLTADGEEYSNINKGLLVLLGIKTTDTIKEATFLMEKIAKLRIFEDENGKLNLSVKDINGEIMLVSNFTLYGETKGQNRPSYITAGRPEMAEPLYNECIKLLNEIVPTKTGVFGADMQIKMEAQGPTTIIMDTEQLMSKN